MLFRTFLLFASLVLASNFVVTNAHAAFINEIRIDQPGSDDDEYIELTGVAAESLNSLTYLVIGDGTGGSGVIEAVVDLTGQSTDMNGFFVIAEATFSLGAANLTADLNFENSDNVTHLLVENFSGANGDDLDTNDDGVLDVTPWTAIVDSVALVETEGTEDQIYGPVSVGPDGSFVPGHVYRCGSQFLIGVFDPTDDTPGAQNVPCLPFLTEIRIDQPDADNDEYVEIGGSALASLDGVTLIVIGDGAGGSGVIEAVVGFGAMDIINANGLFTAAEATFSLGTADAEVGLNFENSDNVTFMLVSGFSGTLQDDLDTNDDGTLDVTPWTDILSSVALVEDLGSGEQVYSNTQVGPDGSFVPGHVYLCPDPAGWQIGVFDPNAEDALDTPGALNACVMDSVGGMAMLLTIPEIQGDSVLSPVDGELVETTGVVIGDFQGNDELRGFYLQDATGDGDATTSDGIFVFDPDGTDVAVGDEVTVTGFVSSFNDNTQISSLTELNINSSNNILAPTVITLPESVEGELEQYEGMLVQIDQTMTISQNFFLARYGQMTLSSPDDNNVPGRMFQPTNQFPASSPEALALADENARRTLFLDDGQDVSALGDNPDPVPYLGGPPANVLRTGDTTAQLIGVLEQGRINSNGDIDYRLQPTVAPVFSSQNLRTAEPAVEQDDLKIASFNVLNYFNTIDTGAEVCGPLADQGCRGADSASEFVRQRDKIFSALQAIDADVVGLIEIENNGLGAGSAIQDLVDGLNAKLGSADYAVLAVDEGATTGIGGDAIAVGFIYKPGTIEPVGTPAVLDTGAFSEAITDGGRNRQPIAASFRDKTGGEQLTVVVNHFKSKGSPPDPALGNGNDDQGDGQGPWNLRRTDAANDLADWLATFPTGIADADILILGDINAYAQEDPMLAFASKGYTNLVKQFEGAESYSFTFDGNAGSLDHALATASLASKVSSVESWHINTDEPTILDYNEEFKANISPAPTGYYVDDVYRSSDHDPVIVTISRQPELMCWAIKTTNNRFVSLCL